MRKFLLIASLICIYFLHISGSLAQSNLSTVLAVDAYNVSNGVPTSISNINGCYVRNIYQKEYQIISTQNNYYGYAKIEFNCGSSLSNKIQLLGPTGKFDIVSPIALADKNKILNGSYEYTGTFTLIVKLANYNQNTDLLIIKEYTEIKTCLIGSKSISTTSSNFYVSNNNIDYTPIVRSNSGVNTEVYFNQEFTQGVEKSCVLNPIQSFMPTYNGGNFYYLKLDPTIISSINNTAAIPARFEFYANESSSTILHDVQFIFQNDGSNDMSRYIVMDHYSLVIRKVNKLTNEEISTYNFENNKSKVGNYAYEYTAEESILSSSCLDGHNPFKKFIIAVGELLPTEKLLVEYNVYNCCSKSWEKITGVQNYADISISYRDDCGLGNQKSYWISDAPNLSMQSLDLIPSIQTNQIYGRVPNKNESDLANYKINHGSSFTSYYGGNGVVFDPLNSVLKVSVVTDAALSYISYNSGGSSSQNVGLYDFVNNPKQQIYFNTLQFVNNLNNTLIIYPVDNKGVVTNEGTNTVRTFSIPLSSMPNYNLILQKINGDDRLWKAQEILSSFLNDYSLCFSMEGYCGSGGVGNWEIRYQLQTSENTCSSMVQTGCSDCWLPLQRKVGTTLVNCPGCLIPGAVTSFAKVERLYYGAFDKDNDRLPDLGEDVNTIHSLSEIQAYNLAQTTPLTVIQTNKVLRGDEVKFTTQFYLSAPSDCESSSRIACRDAQLQYKYAYVQIKIPKQESNQVAVTDGLIQNLSGSLIRGAVEYTISPSAIERNYYDNNQSPNIYYFKIPIASIPGFNSTSYFLSGDKLEISFESRVIYNGTIIKQIPISNITYFTQEEELYNELLTNSPLDLANSSYASCTSNEVRGFNNNGDCSTRKLQMICEFYQSDIVFVPTIVRFAPYNGTGYTSNKECLKYIKSNSTTGYGKEDITSMGGEDNLYGAIDVFTQEFRKPILLSTLGIAIPKGYQFDRIYIRTKSGATYYECSIDETNLSTAQTIINNTIDENRLLEINLLDRYGLVSNTAASIKYNDESVIYDGFYIRLRARCDYLKGYPTTEIPFTNITNSNNERIQTFYQLNNNEYGDNGRLYYEREGAPIRYLQTPNLPVTNYSVDKLNGIGDDFIVQKNKEFVNKIRIKYLNYPNEDTDHSKFNYNGNLKIAFNPNQITSLFSSFTVKFNNVAVIDWSRATTALPSDFVFSAQLASLSGTLYQYVDLDISGSIDLQNITDCDNVLNAIYAIYFGVDCDNQIYSYLDFNEKSCSFLTKSMTLKLDGVDFTADVTSTMIGNSLTTQGTVNHTLQLVANRSEISSLKINTNTPEGTLVTISQIRLRKVSSGTDQTIILDPSFYSINGQLLTIDFPDDVYFQSQTSNVNFYNNLYIDYSFQNSDCSLQNFPVDFIVNADPYYSSTSCKLIKSKSVTSDIINFNHPSVYITSNTQASFYCSSQPVVLTASTNISSTNTTYKWFLDIGSGYTEISGATDAVYTANQSGNYKVVVDINGCVGESVVQVTSILSIQCPAAICPGENPTIRVTNFNNVVGSYETSWFSQASPNRLLHSIEASGDYYAMAIIPGCTLTTTTPCFIELKEAPNIYTFDKSIYLHLNDDVTISVTNPDANMSQSVTLKWSHDASKTDLSPITTNKDGSYSVIATNASTGCMTSSSVVVMSPKIKITLVNNECVSSGSQMGFNFVKVNAQSNITAGNYKWYKVSADLLSKELITTGVSAMINESGIYMVSNDLNQTCEGSYFYIDLTLGVDNVINMIPNSSFEFLDNCPSVDFITDYDCIASIPDFNNPDYAQELIGHYTFTEDAGPWNQPVSGVPLWKANAMYNPYISTPVNEQKFMLVDGDTHKELVWSNEISLTDYPNTFQQFLFVANVKNIDNSATTALRELPEVVVDLTFTSSQNSAYVKRISDLPIQQVLFRDNNSTWVQLKALINRFEDYIGCNDQFYTDALDILKIEIRLKSGGEVGRDIALDELILVPVPYNCNNMAMALDYARVSSVFIRECNVDVVTLSDNSLVTCHGQPVTFDLLNTNTANQLNIIWSNLADFSNILSSDISISFNPTSSSVYYVKVEDPINNCFFRDQVNVYIAEPEIAITSTDDNICSSSSIEFSVSNFTKIGNVDYRWTKNNSLLPQFNGLRTVTLTGLLDGDVIQCNLLNQCKTITDTDLIVTSNAIAIQGQVATANAGPDQSICYPETVTLGVATDFVTSAEWKVNSTVVNTNLVTTVQPTITTDYTLTIIDDHGCISSDQTQVEVKGITPQVNAGPDLTICPGATVQILQSSSSVSNVTWSPSVGVSNQNVLHPSITPTASAEYTIVATEDGSGCNASDKLWINFYPAINETIEYTLDRHIQVNLDNVGDYSFTWEKDELVLSSTTNRYATEASGLYLITIKNNVTGCQKKVTYQLVITSINHINNTTSIQLYPNPAKQELNIICKENVYERMEIWSVNGVKVDERMLQPVFEEQKIQLNLASGVYLIKIFNKEGEVWYSKLVIEK